MSIAIICWRVTLLYVLWGAAIPYRALAQTHTQLTLHEVFSYPAPDSFVIMGIAPLPGGQMALWSMARSYLLIGHDGQYDEVGMGTLRRPIGIAANPTTGSIEVVDAGRQAVLTFENRKLRKLARFPVPIIIDAATKGDTGWFLGGVSSSGTYRVFFVDSDGAIHPVYQEVLPANERGSGRFRLTALGTDVAVTRVSVPFESVVVDTSSTIHLRFRPVPIGDISQEKLELDSRANWISLPLITASGLLLQVLTNTSSDQRLIVLYNEAGAVVRQTEIDLPMGFGGSIPSEQILIAVRRIGTQEIVGYKWSWGAKPPKKGD